MEAIQKALFGLESGTPLVQVDEISLEPVERLGRHRRGPAATDAAGNADAERLLGGAGPLTPSSTPPARRSVGENASG